MNLLVDHTQLMLEEVVWWPGGVMVARVLIMIIEQTSLLSPHCH
jgi:hypothetical protein